MSVAATVDLRPQFGPVRDQGKRPTCLALATSDAHAALRGAWQALSAEFAFYHAQQRGGRKPTDGATLPSMLQAIREDGQPVETAWPYLTDTPADVSQWLPPSSTTPVFRRAGRGTNGNVNAIIAELNQSKPVITLMRLSASFFRVPADGIIDETPGEKPDLHLRHAVIALGHGMRGTDRVVLVRNSWGPRWGQQGYAWITEKFLNARIFSLGHLMEDLSVSASSAAA
jgi:C1A family cysteine protease